ncbi:universal stress protein [Natrialbaceae archaeon AArc-T1-2]|uniref:universal stress protein n=1 Tax=Natrialbaceae archaeon AArc-T1-2 TaxID=3053904 RepID=UPI00255A8A48|nr:universal stress protein [Natrialbaceae archaeon AArc-T1-2]WIV65904.1 universal stress protein [Natrialbaceae archaeon AArc-T1-2]
MVVVAAVDQSDQSDIVVKEGEKISAALDQPLHVVHVMSYADFYDLQKSSVEETGSPREMERVKETAETVATEASDVIDGSSVSVGLVGDAATEVVDYAKQHDTEYIVVGPKKQSPTGKALFGSVSQSIILNSPCSVITTSRSE